IPVIPVVPAEVPIAPADLIVAPEVGSVSVISPTEVLDLVDYSSSSNSDPSEDSLPVAPELPLVSPFLCTNDSEADSESEPAEQRPERHESLTPSSDFPLAPVVAPPEILGPFLAHRLAWRRISHRSSDRRSSPDFTLDSTFSCSSSNSSSYISSGSSSNSYSDSSSVHSLGCDASGQSHSGPSTRVASPRLLNPLVRTPRCSEAFMRWRYAPLSTLYPPTTSESSLDSSSERSLDSSSPSPGPSRKRCRFPTTLVPSSTPILRPIAPALADLPPHKRFRDSYSSEGFGARTKDGIDLGVEVATSDIREDEEEFEAEASAGGMMEVTVDPLDTGGISEPTGGDTPDLEGTLYDISHYMSEVPLNRITEFETTQRRLEAERENLRVRALLCIKRDRVNSLRRHMALSQEEFRQVCRDRDDTQRRLRRLESLVERRLGFRH
ncbi:hypothetical protein Tco_1151594, partial [Tanacetum coccineum]